MPFTSLPHDIVYHLLTELFDDAESLLSLALSTRTCHSVFKEHEEFLVSSCLELLHESDSDLVLRAAEETPGTPQISSFDSGADSQKRPWGRSLNRYILASKLARFLCTLSRFEDTYFYFDHASSAPGMFDEDGSDIVESAITYKTTLDAVLFWMYTTDAEFWDGNHTSLFNHSLKTHGKRNGVFYRVSYDALLQLWTRNTIEKSLRCWYHTNMPYPGTFESRKSFEDEFLKLRKHILWPSKSAICEHHSVLWPYGKDGWKWMGRMSGAWNRDCERWLVFDEKEYFGWKKRAYKEWKEDSEVQENMAKRFCGWVEQVKSYLEG